MTLAVNFGSYSKSDLMLLAALQQDNTLSMTELAKKTGLSANSVRKKYKAFKSQGLISKEVAILDPEKVGGFLYFWVDIKAAGTEHNMTKRISAFANGNVQIIQCFHTTGTWDYKFLIVARTISEFEKFAQEQFSENPGVDNYESNLVIRPLKLGFSLPLL